MGQCISCQKKGLFVSVNSAGLCSACTAMLRTLTDRVGALVDLAGTINDNAQLANEAFQGGRCDKALVLQIIDMSAAANAELDKAVAALGAFRAAQARDIVDKTDETVHALAADALERLKTVAARESDSDC